MPIDSGRVVFSIVIRCLAYPVILIVESHAGLNPDSIRTTYDVFLVLQLTVDVLRERACEQTWETMRDNIIVLCEDLLFPLLGIDPVMCNGTITLQGPHVSTISLQGPHMRTTEQLLYRVPT